MATVTAGFQVLPNGKDVDTDGVIPKIVEVVQNSGLTYHVGPMETVIEGSIDDVFNVIKSAQQVGIDEGASDVLTNIKLHYHEDGVSIKDKLTHVNEGMQGK
ncbi:MTH1187 family thiamine-binding protein [Alkalihalophilus pseudofirmus]|uniref:MTH1187 family thiamine-binding protein n=1 Tax=Alkalihalophilus pseudofirmus TaxID=79885 RepID=A0AAJ2NP70_ALKPS|nr:MTH1187 family thiamine-binding protein [Alkalihalophilus pseudofirmus]MDV2886028.1 MTH1187 family thiamine-binding protein [Alkalihalophilus pseudofirmus]